MGMFTEVGIVPLLESSGGSRTSGGPEGRVRILEWGEMGEGICGRKGGARTDQDAVWIWGLGEGDYVFVGVDF